MYTYIRRAEYRPKTKTCYASEINYVIKNLIFCDFDRNVFLLLRRRCSASSTIVVSVTKSVKFGYRWLFYYIAITSNNNKYTGSS